MRRSTVATIAAAAALAGCPLPQPLPDYPPGAITPPRILVDGIEGHGEVVRLVAAGCAIEPTFSLAAQILDTNNLETVEARWFVNYDAREPTYYRTAKENTISPDPDPLELRRNVPPFEFGVYRYPPPFGTPLLPGPPWKDAGIVRVVELVVSNGFDPAATDNPESPMPNRAPLGPGPGSPQGFETQVYRWTFVTVQETAGTCTAGDPGCVKCPQPPSP